MVKAGTGAYMPHWRKNSFEINGLASRPKYRSASPKPQFQGLPLRPHNCRSALRRWLLATAVCILHISALNVKIPSRWSGTQNRLWIMYFSNAVSPQGCRKNSPSSIIPSMVIFECKAVTFHPRFSCKTRSHSTVLGPSWKLNRQIL